MKKGKIYEPNKVYPTSASWLSVYNSTKNPKRPKRTSVWIKLRLTPDLFSHVQWEAPGIVRAREKGYLEIEAWRRPDGNVRLSVLVEQNVGDEDGFGVEPDEYLVGTVAPDGTFIEPLHIE